MEKSDWISVFLFVIVAITFLTVTNVIDLVSCNAKTVDMGFEHRFTLFGRCQIEVTPNQWIPLDSYYFKQE